MTTVAFSLGYFLLGYEVLSLNALASLMPRYYYLVPQVVLAGAAFGAAAVYFWRDSYFRQANSRTLVLILHPVIYALALLHFKVVEYFAGYDFNFVVLVTLSSTALTFCIGVLQALLLRGSRPLIVNAVFAVGGCAGTVITMHFLDVSYEFGVKLFFQLSAILLAGSLVIYLRSRPFKFWNLAALCGFFVAVSQLVFHPLDGRPYIPTAKIYSNGQTQLKVAWPDREIQSAPNGAKRFPVFNGGHLISYIYDAEELVHLYDLQDEVFYSLLKEFSQESIAIAGTGGGSEILQARLAGYKQIEAIEINPLIVMAAKEFSRRPELGYGAKDVTTHIMDARKYFTHLPPDKKFDVILLPSVKRIASSGAEGRVPSYLLTVEAFADYLEHLKPNGVVIIRNGYKPGRVHHEAYERTLAVASLKSGLPPESKILSAIINQMGTLNLRNPDQFVTILSKTPLEPNQIERLQSIMNSKGEFLMRSVEQVSQLPVPVLSDDRPMPIWIKLSGGKDAWYFQPLILMLIPALGFLLLWMRGFLRRYPHSFSSFAFCSGLLFSALQVLFLARISFSSGRADHAVVITVLAFLIASAVGSLLADYYLAKIEPWTGALLIGLALSTVVSLEIVSALAPLPWAPVYIVWTCGAVAAIPALLNSLTFALVFKKVATLNSQSIPLIIALNGLGCLVGGMLILFWSTELGLRASIGLCFLFAITLIFHAIKGPAHLPHS